MSDVFSENCLHCQLNRALTEWRSKYAARNVDNVIVAEPNTEMGDMVSFVGQMISTYSAELSASTAMSMVMAFQTELMVEVIAGRDDMGDPDEDVSEADALFDREVPHGRPN
jgi:hypothetical protein